MLNDLGLLLCLVGYLPPSSSSVFCHPAPAWEFLGVPRWFNLRRSEALKDRGVIGMGLRDLGDIGDIVE